MLILEYHGVAPLVTGKAGQWVTFDNKRYDLNRLRVSPDQFERHLRFLLSKGYKNISLRECMERYPESLRSGDRAFCVTFDDGYMDNYTYALPILRRYGCTATVFLVVEQIERASVNKDGIFLTWKEVRLMAEGGIEFGSHTFTHPDLRRLSLENARREIGRSKVAIEERLGAPVRLFSYPYGFFTPEVQDIVRECGYSGAVVTPVEAGMAEGQYAMKRIGLYRHNSMIEVWWKLGPLFPLLRENRLARRLHRAVNWIVRR